MKKRLLITSIVMMLVVAVALSTATYAWFTSNASVTANSINMTAAVNNAEALEINWVNTQGAWLTEITSVTPTSVAGFKPAAPETLALHATTPSAVTGSYYEDLTWKNATVINGKFNADVTEVDTNYVWNDGTGEGKGHTSFYLHNASTANPIAGITMTADIDGAAASFIRVAVFKYNSTASKFELYGIISNGEFYTLAKSYVAETDYYNTDGTVATITDSDENGSISAEEFAAAGQVYTKSAVTSVATGTVAANDTLVSTNISNQNICTTSVALGSLGVEDGVAGGSDEMQLKVVAWMDGAALNDDTAGSTGKVSSIELTFTASRN